ncbi:V-type ATP synthase subunit E [Enterococcus sp. LJL98]
MSDITKLTMKIIADAKQKQMHLLEEAEKEILENEQIKKKQIEKEASEQLRRYDRELQKELSLKVSELHVKSRNRVLAAKQQVLDELFEAAKEALEEISPADFQQFVLEKLQATQVTGEVELIFGSKSREIVTSELLASWQEALGETVHLTIAPRTIPNRSGVVFKQQEIEFNFIFEALLEAKEEELSYQLIALIFSEA